MKYNTEELKEELLKTKVLSMSEAKNILGTNSSATVARKLKALGAISSFSHAGGYYTLPSIPDYDENGLWNCSGIRFSIDGTSLKTIRRLVRESSEGLFSEELDRLLHVRTANSLTKLYCGGVLSRRQLNSKYLYLWPKHESLQLKTRKTSLFEHKVIPGYENKEIKNHLMRFLNILNEKQKRLFLGFESMRCGRGGDYAIAEISGVNRKTIGKGRRELEKSNIDLKRVRNVGGGRKELKKKRY